MEKPMYYCNIAQIEGISLNYFRIGFGIVKDRLKPNLEDDLDFYLLTSPQHFKALTNLFVQNLKIYEQIFGEIIMEANEETLRTIGEEAEVI